MKKCIGLIILCVMVTLLSGCGQTNVIIAEPAIVSSRDGSITQTIVESFDKDYYDINELIDTYNSAFNEYESAHSNQMITLTDAHTENGKVFVTIKYSSYICARDFGGADVFYGIVNDAYDAGYDFDINLMNVLNGEVIGKAEMMDIKNNHLLIVSEPGLVCTDFKILYVSPNVEVLSEKKVRVSSDSGGFAYIVMK